MPKRNEPLLEPNEWAFSPATLVDAAIVARLVYTHPATRDLSQEKKNELRQELSLALPEARDALRRRTSGRAVKYGAQGLELLAANAFIAWRKFGLDPTIFDQSAFPDDHEGRSPFMDFLFRLARRAGLTMKDCAAAGTKRRGRPSAVAKKKQQQDIADAEKQAQRELDSLVWSLNDWNTEERGVEFEPGERRSLAKHAERAKKKFKLSQ